MQTLTLIKLGGSLITDKKKAKTPRPQVMERLAKEISEALKTYKGGLIIGHGGGSYPHPVADKYQTQKGYINEKSLMGFPLVAMAAREINFLLMGKLIDKKIKAVSFSPLSFIVSNKGKTKKYLLGQIDKALSLGLTPVVYGDVVMDETRGFGIYSGEMVINLLAREFVGKYKLRVIYCGETDGVYGEGGKTIAQITPKSFTSIKKNLIGASGVDVTGGILHKVKESLELARRYQVSTVIINGKKVGVLKKTILGQRIEGATVIKS